MAKKNIFGKNYQKDFFPNFGYSTLTLQPETLESQSKAQKTCILA